MEVGVGPPEAGTLLLAVLNSIQLLLLVWLRREQSRVKEELHKANGKVRNR